MRPVAYMSCSGNLFHDKSAAGPNAIPLIPIPIPLTSIRAINTTKSIGRKISHDQIDWPLIRAVERAHGIYDPEDI